MTICYFGDYNPQYSRNRVLLKGLRESGVAILECHTTLRGFRGWMDLRKKVRTIGSYDLLLVAYSDSRWLVPLAKMISKQPVVWDAFYSLYDSWVSDRKLVSVYHPKAWWYFMLDWFSAHLADRVLLDTNAHIEYFVQTFGVSRRHCIRVLVGTDDSLFHP